MWPIPLTPLAAAVRTLNVLNVSSSSRDWRIVLLAGGLPLRQLPPSLFTSKYPPLFTQFRVLPTQVLAFVLPTCWVQHSHHAWTSSSSTLLLTRVCPPSIPPLLASGLTFSAAAAFQRSYHRHGCRGNDFALLGGITVSHAVGRLALSASTSSRINRCHEGTLIHARTL